MIPQIRQVTLDTTNPRASAEFWRQFLGLVYRQGHETPERGEDDAAGRDWLNLLTPAGDPCLAFQAVDELPRATWPDAGIPQQLHLDLSVSSVDELMSAKARVLELGGALLNDRSDRSEEPLLVFSDLDGHPFCVFVVS
jgi:catechol 2,3-dioxygenase-like lactoylglutathione lyase family enzyme